MPFHKAVWKVEIQVPARNSERLLFALTSVSSNLTVMCGCKPSLRTDDVLDYLLSCVVVNLHCAQMMFLTTYCHVWL
jgi:hypothetical protein